MAHPDKFPGLPIEPDEVVAFLDTHPEFFKAVKGIYHESLASRDPDSAFDDYLVRQYTTITETIAETNLEFTNGILSRSANNRFILIDRLQKQLPAMKPIPLIWPAQGSSSIGVADFALATIGPSRGEDEKSKFSDDSFLNNQRRPSVNFLSQSEDYEAFNNTNTVPESFFSRLAVSIASHHIYARNETPGQIVHRLYSIKYLPEYILKLGNGAELEWLKGLHVALPRKVLDLGRVVLTRDMEDNEVHKNWPTSAFAVMVDMESETKAVWLVCDDHLSPCIPPVRGIPSDQTRDRGVVREHFDPTRMDLALLFPSIRDWASRENTWPEIESRIRQSSMKLGISLTRLCRMKSPALGRRDRQHFAWSGMW